MKANLKIREKARNSGVHLWQIADALGMQESSFSKKLRKELPDDEQKKILEIIRELAERREVS